MKQLVRWFLRAVQVVFVLVLVAGAIGFYVVYQMFAPAGPGGPRTFHVARGMSADDLVGRLGEDHLVRSAAAFHLLLRASHVMAGLQAGDYRLSPSMSAYDMVETLKKGPQTEPGIMVTIPEGKTLKQVAKLVAARTGMSARDFYLLALRPRKLFPQMTFLPEHDSAEGYLFPDTYRVVKSTRPSQLLKMMLDRFVQVVLPAFHDARVPVSRLRSLLVLASLVEGEAQVPSERPRIAAVYLNRLHDGMKMECDATIEYALRSHKTALSFADLKVASPYNTYLHAGLPPGPICNPGLASIEAALHPAHDDSLYYVRNDRTNDGSHVFSKTFAEQERAISQYQRR